MGEGYAEMNLNSAVTKMSEMRKVGELYSRTCLVGNSKDKINTSYQRYLLSGQVYVLYV